MKKIVVINTKTGEVQSVEKYVKGSSEIWVAGWIGEGEDHMMNPEQERRAMQTIFHKLDMHMGNIQNMNHRLELQENATYEFSNQGAGLAEKIEVMIKGFDDKILKIVGALEDLNERVSRIENLIKDVDLSGLKAYTFQEFDAIIKELNYQKDLLESHLELVQLSDAQRLRGLFEAKGTTKKPAKKPAKKPIVKSTKKPKKA